MVTNVSTVRPGAGEVLIVGNQILIDPRFPGAGEVLIVGNIPVVLIAERTIPVSAGEVQLVGNTPTVFNPSVMAAIMAASTRRRRFAATYSPSYPPPPYDVTTYTVLQPPYGRLVQISGGEVRIEGPQPTLIVDAVHFAGPGAGEVLIESAGPFAFWRNEAPAGAGEVLIVGYPILLGPLETELTAGSGVVEIVGYNPTIDRVIGWSAIAAGSITWSATTTVVGSWSEVVVTTSIWTRQ